MTKVTTPSVVVSIYTAKFNTKIYVVCSILFLQKHHYNHYFAT
jgi:hypothetical protein